MTRAVDTYTRADNASLIGTASGGFAYTVTMGTFGISSNQFENKATVCRARAELDLGSADHYAQVSYKSFSAAAANQCAVCVRFDAAADTCYYGTIREDGVSTRIIKVVAGVTTTLVTATTTGVATGDIVRLEVVGTALTLYKNGVVMTTVADASLTTGTRAGIESVGSTSNLCGGDNFAAAPLTIGSASGSISVTASATGRAVINGSAAGAVTIAATVAARSVVKGVAASTITVSAASTGRAVIRGAASMVVAISAAATARAVVKGAASLTVTVSAASIGRAVVRGSAAGIVTMTALASNKELIVGDPSAVIAIVATAAGVQVVQTYLYDASVIVNQHVVWQKLSAGEQDNLTANYPRRGIAPPDDDVFGDDVDPRFEQWLDGAYVARHSTDSIDDDPTGAS